MSEMVYYFTHVGMVPVFVFYIIMLCKVRYRYNSFQRNLIKIPVFALELLLLTNPLTNLFFVVSGKFQYERGIAIYAAYGISIFYFCLAVYILIRFWNAIMGTKRVAMVYFLSLVMIGTIIQMIFPSIKCELLCEAIGISGIMIMVEKDDDRTDYASKAFNRTAFGQDLRTYVKLQRSFFAFCVIIKNFDMYRKIYGVRIIDKLMESITYFLMVDEEEASVYHTSFEVFFVLYPDKTPEQIKKITEKIEKRFGESWKIENEDVILDITLVVAQFPEQFKSVDDIFLLESAPLQCSDKKVFSGSDLDFILRRIEVEKAIGRGISDNSFSVYYQPVYQADILWIKQAQVSLRLTDKFLGEISSKEFMEVAETSGFIEELQLRTIESVCRFMSNGIDRSDMQIDFLLIPIMSASLIKKELFVKIREYVQHFNINPSLLAFVIKENYYFYARETLEYLSKEILNMNVRFYVSNYEAGFLGLNALTGFDFEGVILDIHSIFEKENSENADIVLANRTNMIRQLGKKIIISGIDNKEYYDKIKNVEADYVWGEFFSRPVSKNELQNKFWHGEHLVIDDDKVIRLNEEESI
ncbi:MAG: GGDEF domain-containing protein [Butyrivibrio sp.]|nr:GGDEF domain-containing protein [Butyrivibrio sp.]